MTDDEWEKRRDRAIAAAFQTGRPVFADNEGELRYVDGDREAVPATVGADIGISMEPIPQASPSLAVRAERASHLAFVASAIAAVANAVVAIWNPWHFIFAVVLVGSAVIWRRVNLHQRSKLRETEERRDG